jgi:hypothetical protein
VTRRQGQVSRSKGKPGAKSGEDRG